MNHANLPKGSVYDQYTWPEIRDLQKVDRVAVIPVSAVEQHGLHLPLDTDEVLVWSVCTEATKRAPEDIVLLPLVPYGICEMTGGYPGTISISPETLHKLSDRAESGRGVAIASIEFPFLNRSKYLTRRWVNSLILYSPPAQNSR